MARSLRRRARLGSGHHPVWLSVACGLAVVSLSAHSLVAEARGGSPAGNPLGQVEDTPTLASESQGIDLVLLVDKSASGDDQFRDVQHVAITLLGHLSPDDRVELVAFDSRVEIVEPFTSDHARVEEAIGRMRARGSTSLYNAEGQR